MKKLLPVFLSFFATVGFGQTKLIITGAFDGPLPGGHPKGIELFALDAIDDLSIYGMGSANNGGGTDGEEFTLPAGSVGAGSYLYVVSDSAGFHDFFGFAPDYAPGSPASVNGDDAIELFMNGNVVDVFGDINTDGTGQPWEYLDGWAYRQNSTGPDGTTFDINNWMFSGPDALDGETSNSTAMTPFPIGTYSVNPNVNLEANDDRIVTQINMGVTVNLLDNDNLPNGFDQFINGRDPMNGTATYMNDGTVTYMPNADFCGDDDFTYVVCMNTDCDTATVSVLVECPLIYETKNIGEVSQVDSLGNPVSAGDLVALTGVVHSINFRPNGLQFALIDANNDGITVFNNSGNLGYTVAQGDELTVKGDIGSFRGALQLYADSVNLNSQNNDLFDPTIVTELNESTESQLVKIENLSIVDPGDWSNSGSGFNVEVTDGTNTYAMRIVSATDIFDTDAPDRTFNLTGIGGQFDFDEPFTEGYQIFPRSLADFEFGLNTGDIDLKNSVKISPNPARDFLNISGARGVDRIMIFDYLGQPMKQIINPSISSTISTDFLCKGVYFLRFEKGGELWTTKFVKQ